RFVGVAAADVYLRHFEAAVLPALLRLPVPARLVCPVNTMSNKRMPTWSFTRSCEHPFEYAHYTQPCGICQNRKATGRT
ncbi:hypothetical protein ACWGK1_41140, partial [Streptomyces wedmorensis]